MTKHARLSASASHRWISCPGSVALEESLPEHLRKSESKYSVEGTNAHSMAAHALETGKSCSFILHESPMEGWNFDMAAEVQKYVDLVRDMAEGHTLLIEQRVDYSNSIGVPESFGTSDAIIVTADGKELIVLDLKYGRGIEISAEENEQLMLYALGSIETFDMVIDKDALERVRLVISQPRLGAVSEWDCDMEYLDAFRQDAAKAAEKAISGNAQYNPGEEQCRWCKAASICPALNKKVAEVVAKDFQAITEKIRVVSKDGEELSKKMAAVAMIEDWCKAVRAAVEAELLHGNAIPGYKLVEGRRGNRKWINEKEAEKKLKSLFKGDKIYDRSLISPTSAEKLFKEYDVDAAILEDMTSRTEGKPSVAEASDPRLPLVISSVDKDFDTLT